MIPSVEHDSITNTFPSGVERHGQRQAWPVEQCTVPVRGSLEPHQPSPGPKCRVLSLYLTDTTLSYAYVYHAVQIQGDTCVHGPAGGPTVAELWPGQLCIYSSIQTHPLGMARRDAAGDLWHCVFLNQCKSLFPDQLTLKHLFLKL